MENRPGTLLLGKSLSCTARVPVVPQSPMSKCVTIVICTCPYHDNFSNFTFAVV